MDNELYSWTIQQYQDFSIELLSTELASYGKGDNIEIGKDTNAFILILSGTATVINNENFMLNRKMIDMPHSVQNNTLLFSPKLMLTSLSVLSSDFKCLIIQFRMYGSITDPNPKSVMDYGQVLKFHELSISLPRRILLQPAVEPYSFFIRIIDEIKASSDAGSDLFIKSLLTAIIIRLLRDSTPESNRSISFFNSICFSSFSNNETPIEQGTSIWITDVDIYDRATSTFDESRQIAHLPLTFIHQELPEKDKLSFAIDPQTNYNGKPTAQIIAYETSPFRLWIFMNAEQTGINIADYKDTCCFRFSIKANRPVSLGMAFIDDENGSYNQQVITLSHANRWETVTVFLNPAKNYNSSAQHIQKALIYINEHIYERIRIQDIAQEIHISVPYLSRIFRDQMRVPIMTYIISKRIDLSKRELAETTNSIESIAQKMGFYDIQHFSKTFLQYVKISPRDYRKLTNLQFNVKNPERVEKGKKRKNVETEN